MVSERTPERLPIHAARGDRHARRRASAPVVTVLLLTVCFLAIAGVLAKARDPGTAASARTREIPSEPVVSKDRLTATLVLPNAGFEAGMEGWRPVSAKLTRATPGKDSDGAAKVAAGPTTDSDEEGPGIRAFAVVPSAPSETLASVTVWVRAVEPGIAVVLKVIERDNERAVGATTATRRLGGTGWQQLTVAHRVRVNGAAIDVLVAAPSASSPFLVDAVTVRLDRAPPEPSGTPGSDEATGDDAPLIADG
jgi:hypothetical protein